MYVTTGREFDERRNTSRTFQPEAGAASLIPRMTGPCRDCGNKNPVPASHCLWCYDLALLSGGWSPDRLEERWTDEQLALLKSRAAAVMARKIQDRQLRIAARRRAKAERGRVEDGQAVMV